MQAASLDIILPCYNPSTGWDEKIITSFKELCKKLPAVQLNIILVNDGSEKGISEQQVTQIKNSIYFFKYIAYTSNKGKGHALREGVKQSEADIIIYTDIDFPYTLASIAQVWNELSAGNADIVAGVYDQNYYSHVPPGREFISKLLRFVAANMFRLKIADTQRGLKGFNEKGKQLFLKTTINRYLFDLEFIYLASKKKSHVILKPLPVQLREHIRFSKMKPRVLLTESFNFLKIFFRSIFGLG